MGGRSGSSVPGKHNAHDKRVGPFKPAARDSRTIGANHHYDTGTKNANLEGTPPASGHDGGDKLVGRASGSQDNQHIESRPNRNPKSNYKPRANAKRSVPKAATDANAPEANHCVTRSSSKRKSNELGDDNTSDSTASPPASKKTNFSDEYSPPETFAKTSLSSSDAVASRSASSPASLPTSPATPSPSRTYTPTNERPSPGEDSGVELPNTRKLRSSRKGRDEEAEKEER